jgi:pyruvate-formate lyase-activating enzyme
LGAAAVSRTQDRGDRAWAGCRFLTCSVLPVRRACNLDCPFCFSKSSISALEGEGAAWEAIDLARYYEYAYERGARRLVITGGGEPLLKPQRALQAIRQGRRWFDEIACFTNGTYLTRSLAQQLSDAGLSYLCYSRHHEDDGICRQLMGHSAPLLADFLAAAGGLRIRATCVMARGFIDDAAAVARYMTVLSAHGVREFTFKHTYVAYRHSVYGGSPQDTWAQQHRVAADPFQYAGELLQVLPWGPEIRRVGAATVCFYHEPDPEWEKENKLCRSINLLSDGSVYASLEDQRSLLYRQS